MPSTGKLPWQPFVNPHKMNRPDFKFKLSIDQERKAKFLAKNEGLTYLEWMQREATKVVMQLLGETEDLDPKAAGVHLGVSKFTVIRYFNQGLFPNAYMLNSRVIRIPLADVEKLKKDRRLVVD